MSADAPVCKPGQKAKCLPCEGLTACVPEDEAADRVAKTLAPLWSLKVENKPWSGKDPQTKEPVSKPHYQTIERSLTAKHFQAALDFVNKVGALAEEHGHHPDLHIESWRNVRIVLYTHALGGLSENDFILAEAIDAECPVVYSPKFLKDNAEVAAREEILAKARAVAE